MTQRQTGAYAQIRLAIGNEFRRISERVASRFSITIKASEKVAVGAQIDLEL